MKKAQFGGELGQKLKSEISKSLKKKPKMLWKGQRQDGNLMQVP